jgi:uncharacterized protein
MSESTPPENPYQAAQPLNPGDEKLWSTLVHIGGIFFYFLPALIGYLAFKDRGPFVRQHTTAALNFQITIGLASIIGGITTVLLIGFLILGAAAIVNLIFSIIAAVAANRGEHYEYPLAIKFIK